MTEFDFRTECGRCKGSGAVLGHPLDEGMEYLGNGIFAGKCYICKGEGKLPLEGSVELEEYE